MKTAKILHVSDLGLKNLPYGGINLETGLNRRFEDVYNNFKLVISEAIRREVEYFIIAGDINEERNPESILIEKFSECIADLISQDIKVIVIAGNHDLDSSKGTSSSISYIKALGLINTYVADMGVETFEFDNVVFHCVPHMYPRQAECADNEELTKWLHDYISGINTNNDKINILVSHYSLETTFAHLNIDEAVLKIDDLKKFDYVALGHIHKYEMFQDFVGGYTGSLFCKDFGEQNDKYFNIVDIEPNRSSHEISAYDTHINQVMIPERRFVTIDFDARDKDPDELIDEIEAMMDEEIKGNIIKVRIKAHKRFNPKGVYEVLRKRNVFHYIPIEWKIQREDKEQTIIVSKETTDLGIVEQYVSKQDISKEFKNDVINYIDGIIKRWNAELVS